MPPPAHRPGQAPITRMAPRLAPVPRAVATAPDPAQIKKVVKIVKKPAPKPVELRARPPIDDQFDATLTFSIDLWNLTFPAPGDYSFRILVNGSERKRLPLLVLRPPAGTDDDGPATGARQADD